MPFPPVEVLTGRVDVFHGTNFVLPPALRSTAGVVTVHDLAFLHHADTTRPEVAAYRRLVPKAGTRSKGVVVVSQAVQEEVIDEYGLAADRVVVAHHGVDPAWFEARPPSKADLQRLGLPQRYLLFVGNLEPRKNLRTLLDAHGKARAESPDVPHLVLVGAAGWGYRRRVPPRIPPTSSRRLPVRPRPSIRGGRRNRGLHALALRRIRPAAAGGARHRPSRPRQRYRRPSRSRSGTRHPHSGHGRRRLGGRHCGGVREYAH